MTKVCCCLNYTLTIVYIVIDHLKHNEASKLNILVKKSDITCLTINNFNFLQRHGKIQSKRVNFHIDLEEWSNMEKIVEIKLINQYSSDVITGLWVYDSTLLKDDKKVFPYHQIDNK